MKAINISSFSFLSASLKDIKLYKLVICIVAFALFIDVICITIIPQKREKGIELCRSNISIVPWNYISTHLKLILIN